MVKVVSIRITSTLFYYLVLCIVRQAPSEKVENIRNLHLLQLGKLVYKYVIGVNSFQSLGVLCI